MRQAVAYAIPYQKIMDAVLFGLAGPMYGAKPRCADQVAWPQPHTYDTDIAKAKQLLAEAGYPNGFETTLSFDLGFAVVNEPLCVLVQESLAQIGIKTDDQQDPRRQLAHRAEQEGAAARSPTCSRAGSTIPKYFFFWCYHGQNADLQHDELPGQGDGRADRRARRGGRQRRQGGLREET